MKILSSTSLKPYNTFAIEHRAQHVVKAETVADLINIYSNEPWSKLPKLILGKGSNTLFCSDYCGVVVLNKIEGIQVIEDNDSYLLAIGAGVNWPSLVEWTLDNNIDGLENLAMIPGCAGTAPIQNIGAYGVEFKDVCDYVEYLDLDTMEVRRLCKDKCLFNYRDSIFKKQLNGKAIITAIGLKLPKQWKPVLEYGSLASANESEITARDVYDRICLIRSEKLPDPTVLGNAGSFYKNPVVTIEKYQKLKEQYVGIPGYKYADGYKLAAGWLIDNAGLKGYVIGGAQVHENQALVLTNTGKATSRDIIDLAYYVQQEVYTKYEIMLEHEVRFMGSQQETNLNEIFQ
ncbi:MAG: UDP-N-acetylmuramate dehydrogenase [Aliivibrio sp.]|uniref:UDP-N-acetylmuramate dehydrogenase n=1 Tax=Aliivibrio sp. TaxID=1872443 RepID=UPI001A5EEF46|nr:UDP-N-acetylmuramate dehydrogenase [Aliivibrio sp.]